MIGGERGQTQIGMIDPRSFAEVHRRQPWERGNAYLAPNALTRALALGGFESFDCRPTGGERRDPVAARPPGRDPTPPCFEAPAVALRRQAFHKLRKGKAPKRDAPKDRTGSRPAVDPNPNDPTN